MPDAALLALTFVWGMVGWAFMAPQQSRVVSLDPESQNVSLSLNASAIYVGAAIGSAAGGRSSTARFLGARLGIRPRDRRACSGISLLTLWLVWRRGRAAAGFEAAG